MAAVDLDAIIKKLEKYRVIVLDDNNSDWDAKMYSEIRAETESWVSILYPNDQQLWNYLNVAFPSPKDDDQWIKSKNALVMVTTSLLDKLKYRKKLEGQEKQSTKQLKTDITEKVRSYDGEASEHKKTQVAGYTGYSP